MKELGIDVPLPCYVLTVIDGVCVEMPQQCADGSFAIPSTDEDGEIICTCPEESDPCSEYQEAMKELGLDVPLPCYVLTVIDGVCVEMPQLCADGSFAVPDTDEYGETICTCPEDDYYYLTSTTPVTPPTATTPTLG
jgi:hypothetical protein